jgi:hypothetical protein
MAIIPPAEKPLVRISYFRDLNPQRGLKISLNPRSILSNARTAFSVSEHIITSGTLGMQAACLVKPHLLTSTSFATSLSICSYVAGGMLCAAGIWNITDALIKLGRGENKCNCSTQILNGLCQMALGIVLILAATGKLSLFAHPWIIPLIFMIPALVMMLKNGKEWILLAKSQTLYQKLGLDKKEGLIELIKQVTELQKDDDIPPELVTNLKTSINSFFQALGTDGESRPFPVAQKEKMDELAEEIGVERTIKVSGLVGHLNELLDILKIEKPTTTPRLQELASQIIPKLESIKRNHFYWRLSFRTLITLLYISGFGLSMVSFYYPISHLSSSLAEGIDINLAVIANIAQNLINPISPQDIADKEDQLLEEEESTISIKRPTPQASCPYEVGPEESFS